MASLTPADQVPSNILSWIAAGVAVGAVTSLLLGFPTESGRGAAILVLLALASALVGSFLGLLFGTPERRNATAANEDNKLGFRGSDNLKQIADWLTKIIVGVTLTQFSYIVGFLDRAATFAAAAFPVENGGAAVWAKSAAFSVMLLDGAAGFWCGYLWTARYLPKILDDGERARAEGRDIARAGQMGTLQSRTADSEPLVSESVAEITPGPVPDDPWKGAFGGRHKADNWELSAKVEGLSTGQLFRVILQCKHSADPQDGETVKFFLHPTFKKQVQAVPTDAQGVAELVLIAWGAFTVGALTNDGTRLELDLAKIEAPSLFRNR